MEGNHRLAQLRNKNNDLNIKQTYQDDNNKDYRMVTIDSEYQNQPNLGNFYDFGTFQQQKNRNLQEGSSLSSIVHSKYNEREYLVDGISDMRSIDEIPKMVRQPAFKNGFDRDFQLDKDTDFYNQAKTNSQYDKYFSDQKSVTTTSTSANTTIIKLLKNSSSSKVTDDAKKLKPNKVKFLFNCENYVQIFSSFIF